MVLPRQFGFKHQSIGFLILAANIFSGLLYAQGSVHNPPTRILEARNFHDYRGTLGHRRLGLFIGSDSAGDLTGHYFYYDDLKDIPFRGRILGPLTFELRSDSNLFDLQFDSSNTGRIFGIAQRPSHASDSVYLQLDDIIYGNPARRYRSSLPDSEVERKIQAFYFAVVNGNPKVAVKYVSFPFTATLPNWKKLLFNRPSQLLRKWRAIFTPKFIASIKQYPPHDLFVNGDGACLGFGQFWFDFDGWATSVFTVP